MEMFHVFLVCPGLALILILIYGKTPLKIKLWKKSLNLGKHAQLFQQIYQDANGFKLSQRARQGRDAMEYTYGEIEFISFIALLSLTNPDENTVFYDLGSGTGKAVLACGMVFPVRKSVGIELFPELYLDSSDRLKRLAAIKNYADKARRIHFILGDFLEISLDDATLIFINSTAFFGSSWNNLCSRIDQLPHLKAIITTSKALDCANYPVFMRTRVEMSWGVVFAYIHIRKTNCN